MTMASKGNPRLVVLSIDGVPYGFVEKLIAQGDAPNLASLVSANDLRKMRSIQPTVSCVAWSTYMTGANPGKHGIYGFIDRQPNTYEIMLPNSTTRTAKDIWQILTEAGKRVFCMNVPTTYPPYPINGIMIGCFLSPSLKKATYPANVSDYLASINYRIDSDAALARKDKNAMLVDLDKTLEARAEAMFHFLDQEDWDFFHTHIMGTDRINHFLWRKMEENDPHFAPAFYAYYRKIDGVIGKLLRRIGDDTALMIFSDHGFCAIRYEVQLSRWLIELGWTKPAANVQHPLSIDPEKSRAYCLIPGRVYVNLAGREPHGIVPVKEYQQTRQKIAADLLKLRDPETGQAVVRKVLLREDIYWPAGSRGPCRLSPEEVACADGTFGQAADVIAVPYDGYDLKMGLAGDTIFQQTALEGMHTYEDAFLVSRGVDLPQDNLEIMMPARSILKALGVEPPADMDGSGQAVTCNF